uniref:OBP27 n=1 Tax=Episyrphus balteatus TaxID=286459 RepID=A0A6H0D300_EPIBA|nr:OBP27 [Episyrphus balteatus]
MKFLILVAAIALFDIVSAVEDCQFEKLKLTDDQIRKLERGQLTDASEDIKCFIECDMEKAGLFKNGKLQEDAAMEKFTAKVGKENAEKILNSCRGEKGSTNCETAFRLSNCFSPALIELLQKKV